jgi:hypothetical protein
MAGQMQSLSLLFLLRRAKVQGKGSFKDSPTTSLATDHSSRGLGTEAKLRRSNAAGRKACWSQNLCMRREGPVSTNRIRMGDSAEGCPLTLLDPARHLASNCSTRESDAKGQGHVGRKMQAATNARERGPAGSRVVQVMLAAAVLGPPAHAMPCLAAIAATVRVPTAVRQPAASRTRSGLRDVGSPAVGTCVFACRRPHRDGNLHCGNRASLDVPASACARASTGLRGVRP